MILQQQSNDTRSLLRKYKREDLGVLFPNHLAKGLLMCTETS